MRLAWICWVVALASCGDDAIVVDAAAPGADGGSIGDAGGFVDGALLASAFTATGCASLDVTGGQTRCTGGAPLVVTFVPVGSGATTFQWTFASGEPSTSTEATPTVTFRWPGTYAVTLIASGAAGSTSASGTVVVTSNGVGAPCAATAECSAGLTCLCGNGGCPGALADGVCTRGCSGGGCGMAAVCADLTRGAPAVGDSDVDGGAPDGGTDDEWRRSICLPTCATSSDCRPGFTCRELPVLDSGAASGGSYSWQRACFADLLGDDGDACFSEWSMPDPGRCLSGRCDALGDRGLCTSDCASIACPSTAACAAFNDAPSARLCLARCDATHPCADPLLDCLPAHQTGSLGFTVPASEPAGATYCAPRRCMLPTDCPPSGMCVAEGSASFCVRP
jgi:PKD repeat protein